MLDDWRSGLRINTNVNLYLLQIPIQKPIILFDLKSNRQTAKTLGRSTSRGGLWRLRVCPDMFEYLQDVGAVRGEAKVAHLPIKTHPTLLHTLLTIPSAVHSLALQVLIFSKNPVSVRRSLIAEKFQRPSIARCRATSRCICSMDTAVSTSRAIAA